jgi:hypothetical protein
LAAAAASLTSCVPETTLPEGTIVPTGIKIAPEQFLGKVECTDRPGGMQSYVATLVDVSDPDAPFVLPSSPPTTCAVPTDFQFLVVGNAYVGEIDGYAQPASELSPLNGTASGSRHMILDTFPISPRWQGECAGGEGNAAVASPDFDVDMRYCAPLRDSEGAVSTGIEVDPTVVLGDLRCGDIGGTVSSFSIAVQGGAFPKQQARACTSDVLPTWIFDTGVKVGREYHFLVTAKDVGGKSLGSSSCYATAIQGLTVLAVCTDLNP